MQYIHSFRRRFTILALTLGLPLASATGLQAQTEAEPNNSCAAAQDLSTTTSSITVTGSLDSPPSTPDVDFYRFTGNPGDMVIIDHRRSGTNPLSDPYMGVFAGDCLTLLASDDDSGGNFNSRLTLSIPDDGQFVVAASSYGDYELTGHGSSTGTYTLTVERQAVAQGAFGKVVDAKTGAGVFGYLNLYSCSGTVCDSHVGSLFTGTGGSFRFDTTSLYGRLLAAGDYKLTVDADNYFRLESSIFHLAEGQLLNLGNLAATRIPTISSIRGRAVDAISRTPMPGTTIPRTRVELQYCPDGGWCWTIRYAYADAQGVFRFEGNDYTPLRGGTYRVQIWADQYQMTEHEFVVAGDQANVDIGDVGVKSLPVRINLAQGCGAIPATGGTCNFTVSIANGLTDRLHGEAWTMILGSGIGSDVYRTSFQTEASKALNLAPGESITLPFSVFVPADIANGAYICAQGFASQRPHEFNTLGYHDLFCLSKGAEGFTAMTEEQKRSAVKELKNK